MWVSPREQVFLTFRLRNRTSSCFFLFHEESRPPAYASLHACMASPLQGFKTRFINASNLSFLIPGVSYPSSSWQIVKQEAQRDRQCAWCHTASQKEHTGEFFASAAAVKRVLHPFEKCMNPPEIVILDTSADLGGKPLLSGAWSHYLFSGVTRTDLFAAYLKSRENTFLKAPYGKGC